MNKPILCTGNELDKVVSDIQSRGGFVTALETGVGGKNASYRVSYFEREGCPNEDLTTSNHSSRVGSLPPGVPKVEFLPPKRPNVPPGQPKGLAGATECEENSIEDRLAALQEWLSSKGQLQHSKPSTQENHARKPYRDD